MKRILSWFAVLSLSVTPCSALISCGSGSHNHQPLPVKKTEIKTYGLTSLDLSAQPKDIEGAIANKNYLNYKMNYYLTNYKQLLNPVASIENPKIANITFVGVIDNSEGEYMITGLTAGDTYLIFNAENAIKPLKIEIHVGEHMVDTHGIETMQLDLGLGDLDFNKMNFNIQNYTELTQNSQLQVKSTNNDVIGVRLDSNTGEVEVDAKGLGQAEVEIIAPNCLTKKIQVLVVENKEEKTTIFDADQDQYVYDFLKVPNDRKKIFTSDFDKMIDLKLDEQCMLNSLWGFKVFRNVQSFSVIKSSHVYIKGLDFSNSKKGMDWSNLISIDLDDIQMGNIIFSNFSHNIEHFNFVDIWNPFCYNTPDTLPVISYINESKFFDVFGAGFIRSSSFMPYLTSIKITADPGDPKNRQETNLYLPKWMPSLLSLDIESWNWVDFSMPEYMPKIQKIDVLDFEPYKIQLIKLNFVNCNDLKELNISFKESYVWAEITLPKDKMTIENLCLTGMNLKNADLILPKAMPNLKSLNLGLSLKFLTLPTMWNVNSDGLDIDISYNEFHNFVDIHNLNTLYNSSNHKPLVLKLNLRHNYLPSDDDSQWQFMYSVNWVNKDQAVIDREIQQEEMSQQSPDAL